MDQAEPAEGDELTRREDGYVQADVDAWLAHALATHRRHHRDPAAREAAASLLTPPVLAHAALLGELRTLANGMRRDRAVVQAALTTTYTSGAVEGNVTRIKLLKRQMYGRANFELLRRRILLST
ncbi:transposase [Streptomyces sp. A0592]|nr:transposase [Streptomyces sp. A0592]